MIFMQPTGSCTTKASGRARLEPPQERRDARPDPNHLGTVNDAQGRALHHVALFSDITDQKMHRASWNIAL